MSDSYLGENLVTKENIKESGYDEIDDYIEDFGRSSYDPNINFEMNQKTLTSRAINPKDLRGKIEEYLEADGLTRDDVKLLLKQGAEDNFLFMIKEETYDKLIDSLGMKLDHDDDNNVGNISGLLATARLEYSDGKSKSQNIRNLDSTSGRFSCLMKSRLMLRDKSEIGGKQNAAGVQKDLTFTRKQKESNNNPEEFKEESINDPKEFEEEPLLTQPLPPIGSYHAAQETSPYLMERIPKMTNQALKNNLIIAGLIGLSIICFIIWGFVTYNTRKEVVKRIIGYPLLVSRG